MIVPLVLAAGLGRRFGGDKLLARWRGNPLIEHVLDTLGQASEAGLVGRAIVAVGRNDALMETVRLRGLELVMVGNPGPGISASLKAAISSLSSTSGPNVTAALVCLGDQPLIRISTIKALVQAAGEDPTALLRPRYHETPEAPGHPVLVGRSHWPLVEETAGDRGLDPMLAGHGLQWTGVPVPGSNPDIDTPADLERLG